MIKFDDHNAVLDAFNTAQENEEDNRDRMREAHLFVNSRDGQWEPTMWQASEGKPRYTFDMTSPIAKQIVRTIKRLDFDIRVTPAGGDATKKNAQLMDGLVRNIENISNFKATRNLAARLAVVSGLNGWCIKHKYVDDNSFDQDLVIEPIANFVDSVWFGPFKKPDASDMRYGFILEAISPDVYEERWPEGKKQSLSQGRQATAFPNKAKDDIIVGQAYYLKERPAVLHLMSDGRVIEETDETRLVMDELAQAGLTIVNSRTIKKNVCYTRIFDNGGFLTEEQETVFDQIPIVPVIANFEVFEDKLLYHGVVEKLIDPQRVFNYSKSREIEEGALAPRAKYWMTPKQAQGHEKTLSTLNTNADPVQFFNVDPENPGPPQQNGGAQINPGLQGISVDMQEIMRGAAGLYAANMGENPGLQSGVAIERLQDRGDAGSEDYIEAMEIAIQRTGRILVNAIPKVYDTRRQIRILKEDGSFDVTTLNDVVVDTQTGTAVVVNDVTKGKYDVVCKAGPSFDSRQQETVSALTEMAQVDPSIIELGGDILYNNLSSPGMDLLAERKRQQLFQAGMIPMDQLTDEERVLMQQQAQQEPPPDPAMLMAQAEMEKAQAEKETNQVKLAIAQRETELKALELQIKMAEQELKRMEAQQKSVRDIVDIESQQIENAVIRQRFGIEAENTVADTELKYAKADETRRKTDLMGVTNG